MSNEYIVKDSGDRESFSTGMVRDTQQAKPRYDLISPLALYRLAELYRKGSLKYAERNWEAGQPFSRAMASLQRHLYGYLLGDRSEDHLAALAWNTFAIMHYEEAIRLGILPKELMDLPDYTQRIEGSEGT